MRHLLHAQTGASTRLVRMQNDIFVTKQRNLRRMETCLSATRVIFAALAQAVLGVGQCPYGRMTLGHQWLQISLTVLLHTPAG